MAMAYEPGAMHVLWPVGPPSKKLSETVPETFTNSGDTSHTSGGPINFIWIIKKSIGGHFIPQGVVYLRSSTEPKLRLNAASLSDCKTLLVPVNSDLVPGTFLGLVDLGSSDLFIDSVFASKNKLVHQGIEPCPLSLIDGTVNNCVN